MVQLLNALNIRLMRATPLCEFSLIASQMLLMKIHKEELLSSNNTIITNDETQKQYFSWYRFINNNFQTAKRTYLPKLYNSTTVFLKNKKYSRDIHSHKSCLEI